jgi:hypothetical protein
MHWQMARLCHGSSSNLQQLQQHLHQQQQQQQVRLKSLLMLKQR